MNFYRQAVLRSLDVIEQHLKRPIALHALARRAPRRGLAQPAALP